MPIVDPRQCVMKVYMMQGRRFCFLTADNPIRLSGRLRVILLLDWAYGNNQSVILLMGQIR